MMKYIKLIALAVITVFTVGTIVIPSSASAVDVTTPLCSEVGDKPVVCEDAKNGNTTDPAFGADGVVTKAIRLFLMIVGIIAIFVILVNAVRMITSMGSPDSFNSAKNGLIFAVVGLVIVLLAQTIITFVVRKV